MRTLCRIVAICTLACFGLQAQVNKSNLTGIVKDTTGAVVSGVSMRFTNLNTGAARSETTDTGGFYRFTLIDFGRYRLEAEARGFKKFARDGIELNTGETTTVDITLQVGELTELVTVTGESPLLRTETATNGTTVNTQVLNELPLIGRNPYVFLTLSPGIQYTGDPGALNPWDVFGPSDFASSGAEARSEFLLDGIPNMRIDVVSLSPSPDAVQEMRVQTNAYDAEYGHSGAAFVNVSTRGGANTEHGSVYWYHRNDNLNANSFFNNRSGQAKSENKQNTYGGSLSGPVRIPKLYRGVDRTHYFVNFEGTQIRGAGFARAVVPAEPERRGDFSQTRDLQGRPFTIYDPATTTAQGTGFVRSAFAGNLVPASRFDAVAVSALKFYPIPNLAPTSTNRQNFINSQTGGRKWASAAARVDHQLSPTHSLFFRYGWNHRLDPSTAFYGQECCRPAGNPTSGQDEFERGNIGAAAGYTWVVSPRTVADFRLGFSRYFEANLMYGEGFDIAKLGFPSQFASALAFATFPRFEMSGDVENLGAGRTSSRQLINQYNPLVNFHHTFNRHAVKYGFRYQLAQSNSFGPNRSGGFFRFDRVFTQGPDPTRTTLNSGHDFASFLLGTPSRGYVDINANPALQNTYMSWYLQDDWKVTQRLTLNLGLRFEHEGPATDRFNRGVAGFDTTVQSPVAQRAQANYAANRIPELASLPGAGGVRFLAVDKTPRGHLDMPGLTFAPRIGYAYRVTKWMVARGGWGIFFVPNNISNYRLDGFSLATQMVTSLDGNLTPFNRLVNPFPNGLVQPPGASAGLLTAVGQNVTGGISTPGDFLPDFRHGLNQQYSQAFQFVLPGQLSIEAAYVGTHSQRLTINRTGNQYSDQFLDLRTRLNAQAPNPYFGVISDPTSALSQRTTTVAQLLRPYPHFLGVTFANNPYGRGRYDSLQLQISKRMSAGLYFGASYTASKFMEATAYLNANDAKPAKVISNSDRPQRLVLHGLYELPFGKGKRLLSSPNPVVSRVVGGWQMNWVVTFQSGPALVFGDPGADRTERSENNPKSVDQWFDRAQFVPREPFTLRALSTNIADLRAQGIRKWDLTIQKSIAITERVNFKFQTEFYNAFNTPHFAAPNTTVTSTSFSRITGTFLGPRNLQMAARVTF
ncbi:MAG: carboxypeptidase regulatory-like domain-containing protein [Bryobacteraceae bacterium]